MIGKVGYAALLLALALAPIIGGYPAGGIYGADLALNALRALVVVAALCFTISGSLSSYLPEKSAGLVLAIWIAFALTVVSLLVHSRFLTSPVLLFAELPATINWLCYSLLFTLSAQVSLRNRNGIIWILAAICVGVAYAALSGAHDYGLSVQSGNRTERVSGPFFDPNFLAGFLALGLPLIVAGCLAARERLQALGLGVVAAVTAGALTATGSRAGLKCMIAGVGLSLVLMYITSRKRPPIARIAVLAIACCALAFAFRGPISARAASSGTNTDSSTLFRTWTWNGTFSMVRANPILGTGPGTFPYAYPKYALIEKTGLAHESYLELAAEQGALAALLVVCTLVGSFAGAVKILWQSRSSDVDESDSANRILLCGVIGALIAGCARSGADSEWAILGNAFPFWAVAGLAAAGLFTRNSDKSAKPPAVSAPAIRIGTGIGLIAAICLIIAFSKAALLHDVAQTRARAHDSQPDSDFWPPDPDVLYWAGHPDTAAMVEPSGRSYFRLARSREQAGDETGAIDAFQSAVQADPNNLQSWRALAEAQEKSGDEKGALASWGTLIDHAEGPSGRIRAIPELPETHPAYAYAALADAALKSGDANAARSNYERAADVIAAYSRTTPLYQQTEVVTAQSSGTDLAAKHQEIKALFERVINALISLDGNSSSKTADIKQKEQDTLTRLSKFPDSLNQIRAMDSASTAGAVK